MSDRITWEEIGNSKVGNYLITHMRAMYCPNHVRKDLSCVMHCDEMTCDECWRKYGPEEFTNET